MNRVHRRAALLRTRFYVVGLLVFVVLVALQAIGGAITDQQTDAVKSAPSAGKS